MLSFEVGLLNERVSLGVASLAESTNCNSLLGVMSKLGGCDMMATDCLFVCLDSNYDV